MVPCQLCAEVPRFSRLHVREKQFGELEGGGMQSPPGTSLQVSRQARNLFPPAPICSSAIPWKSDPKCPYQTAITTCCVISFRVTLVYHLMLALHSFGIICVSIFQGSFCPARASYRNSRPQENVSNEAVLPAGLCLVLPGQAGAGMHWLESTRPRRWFLFSLETCVKWANTAQISHLLNCAGSGWVKEWKSPPGKCMGTAELQCLVCFLFASWTESFCCNPSCFLV